MALSCPGHLAEGQGHGTRKPWFRRSIVLDSLGNGSKCVVYHVRNGSVVTAVLKLRSHLVLTLSFQKIHFGVPGCVSPPVEEMALLSRCRRLAYLLFELAALPMSNGHDEASAGATVVRDTA